jgi:hypothetical protein
VRHPKSTAAGEGARATQKLMRSHFLYVLKLDDLDGCFWEVGSDFLGKKQVLRFAQDDKFVGGKKADPSLRSGCHTLSE